MYLLNLKSKFEYMERLYIYIKNEKYICILFVSLG